MENTSRQLVLSSLSGRLKPHVRLGVAVSEFAQALDEGRKIEFRRLQNASSDQLSGLDVIRLTEEINKDGERRHSAWMPYGTRVHSFLSRLQMFATVGDVMIGGSQNLIATGVWSAVRLSLMTATNYLGYFEKLSKLFMKLGTSWSLHKDYTQLFGSSEVLQNHLCEYLILLMKLCQKVVVFTRKSHTAQLLSSLGSSFDAEFGAIQKEMEERGVLIQQTAQHLATKTVLDSQRSEFDDHKYRILQMLSPEQAQYVTTWKRQRRKGTCNWIRNAQDYEAWRATEESSTIRITGKLGSGKTVAMANIVADLNMEQPCAFFFCTFQEPNTLKASNILGSIAFHILDSLPVDAFSGGALAKRHDTLSGSLDPDGIVDIILKLAPSNRRYYIVMDGLEDCLEEDINDVILGLHRLAQNRVVLLCYSARADSRFEQRAKASLAAAFCASLDEANHKQEIQDYIKKEVKRRNASGSLNDQTEDLVVEKLTQGSQGMYLWVSLQLDEIFPRYAQAVMTDERILNLILNLPKDLPEAFERALEGITDTRYEGKIMKLVLAAMSPLTLDELRVALTITPGMPIWRPARIPHDGAQIIISCGGNVLELDEEDNQVRFIHHSIVQHLLSTATRPKTSPYHFSNQDAQNFIGSVCVTYLSLAIFESRLSVTKTIRSDELIARIEATTRQASTTSTAYHVARFFKHREHGCSLDSNAFDIGRVASEIQTNSLLHHLDPLCFKNYAVDHWLFHTKYFDQEDKLCLDSWSLWWQLLTGVATTGAIPFPSPTKDPAAALIWAIENGNEAVFFNILINPETKMRNFSQVSQVQKNLKQDWRNPRAELGCVIQLTDIYLNSTFIRFGELGWFEKAGGLCAMIMKRPLPSRRIGAILIRLVIKSLIDSDETVSACSEILHVLLMEMDANGFLLLHDVPVGLRWLIQHGREAALKLLLSFRPNVEVEPPEDPLICLAVAHRNLAIAESLLDAGASATSSFGGGRPAIQWALETGQKDMVKLLGKHGAINIPTSSNTSLLWMAIEQDMDDEWIVLLLDLGADPNAGPFRLDNVAETYPLEIASHKLRTSICLELVFRGAKIFPVIGSSPIRLATGRCNGIVGAAIEDLNAKDCSTEQGAESRSGCSPIALFVALRRFLEDKVEGKWKDELKSILEVFLKMSSEEYLDARDESGNTALHYLASPKRKSDCLALLLNHGADPNSVNSEGQTPLDVAFSSNADMETITLPLVKNGAILAGVTNKHLSPQHIQYQDKNGTTLLHFWAEHSSIGVQLLLDNGAGPNVQNSLFTTPVHVAAYAGRKATPSLKLLLDSGGDPNIKTFAGHDPLHLAVSSFQPDVTAISYLLSAGATVQKGSRRVSLLERALKANWSDADASLAIQKLLQAGADPLSPASTGGTLANFATKRGREASAAALGKHTTDVVSRTSETGETAKQESQVPDTTGAVQITYNLFEALGGVPVLREYTESYESMNKAEDVEVEAPTPSYIRRIFKGIDLRRYARVARKSGN